MGCPTSAKIKLSGNIVLPVLSKDHVLVPLVIETLANPKSLTYMSNCVPLGQVAELILPAAEPCNEARSAVVTTQILAPPSAGSMETLDVGCLINLVTLGCPLSGTNVQNTSEEPREFIKASNAPPSFLMANPLPYAS